MKIIKMVLEKFKVAFEGVKYFFIDHSSAYYLLIATIFIVFLTVILGIGELQIELIILHLGLIWITEMLNTAIEHAVDAKTVDYSESAKKAKDIASAAVFMAYLFFFINLIVTFF